MSPRKCAVYCRVSTEEQKPENQLYALQRYALTRGFEIYKDYVDEISGCADSRPALNDLLTDMRQGLFNVVIVWKLDRLGRSLQHLILLVEEMKRYNVDLVTMTQGEIDTTTSAGKFFFQMVGAMAEFERELIRERTVLGLDRAKRQGKTLGRPKGKKDGKRRRTSGYIQRWAGKKSPPSKIEEVVSDGKQ